MLMLLVAKLSIFRIQIQFRLKGNYKPKSVSKRVVQVVSR